MEFKYAPMFQLGKDETEYYLLTKDYVSVGEFEGRPILKVEAEGLTKMAQQAFHDVSFMLRRSHNEQVAKILRDPEASANDKYVALTFLRNAEVACKGQLPLCQDTGTAIVHGEKGQQVWTGYCDEEALSHGVYNTYTQDNLRYSQNAPLSMYEEVNTKCNLPAQIDIEATEGMEYRFLCVTKGGGSANKTYLYQETKARIQNPGTLIPFLVEKMKSLGTAACPPYHIAIVIGGTSAEKNLLTVKLASTHYYDSLPTTGDETGRAFRDIELEKQLLQEAYKIGLGAQFGGKYMAHDVRVVRLPRHGASCPIGLGVSCSADRNIKCKINKDGIWIERMDNNPGSLIPEALRQAGEGDAVRIDLNQPMRDVCNILTKYPIGTRLSLNGTIIVGRDIAHAKIKARLDAGEPMPEYLKNHPIYYAGPAKTPAGMACGSMGPTTAGRMDPYVDEFQDHGGSLIMLAKGNRSIDVTNACKKHGGFYLGSIGGPAAILAQENIKSIECVEYPELGMEAIWKIEVENFPAFILVDDKGNDFFKQLKPCEGCTILDQELGIKENGRGMNKRQRLCLVDWMLVPLFVGLAITGIGLHLAGHNGQIDMVWHIWTAAHILVSLLFAVFAVWHIRLHWSWYKNLFRGGLGSKSHATIVVSLLFVVLSATGVVLLFIKGANSHVGLWHWGIGLAAVLLFSGHILKRWGVLRQLKMNN